MAALAAAVALPALVLGGALPIVSIVGAVLALIAFLLSLHETERPPALAWVFAALAAYTSLQTVPLPINVVRALSPSAAKIWERGAPGEVVHWASLSLDPGASGLEIVKWCSYAFTLTAAAWLARRKGQAPALWIVFGSALTVTLVWILHSSLELEALYGLYKPRFVTHESLAPFLNRNNLAGYLILGCFSGIGLAYHESLKALRPLIGIGSATLLVAILIARSTGGTAACFAGFALVALFGFSRFRRSPRRLVPLIAISVLGVGITAAVVPPDSWFDIAKYSKKLLLIRWSLPLVRDYFWFGTGRGAYETVFPAYRQGTLEGMPNQVVFTHVENLPVQWAGEWGVPVALLAAGTIGWLLLQTLRTRANSLSETCVLAGIAALILQNMVDLGLELSGVGAAVALLLGTLVGRPVRPPEPEPAAWGRSDAFLMSSAVIGACALFALVRFGFRLAWQARDDAYEALLSVKGKEADNQPFFDELKAQGRRRPAEPYFALIAAQGSQKVGANAMPWIGRAIERDPTRGETYLVLALELGRRRQQVQALDALKIGIREDPTQLRRAVRLARAISQDPDQLVHAAPHGDLGTTFLLTVAAESSYELRAALVARAAERDRENPHVFSAQGQLLIEALTTRRAECADANEVGCMQRMRDLVNRLRAKAPSDFAWLQLSSQLLSYEGKSAEGVDALRRGCPTLRDPAPCLRTAVQLASDSNDAALVEAAITDYLRVACVNAVTCARGEADAGRALMRVGASFKAYEHYQRAAEISPSPGIWSKTAAAARAAGLEARAKTAERRAGRLGSGAKEPPLGLDPLQ